MINKYTEESKRKDLGLSLAIFVQVLSRTSENNIIRVSSDLCLWQNTVLIEYIGSLFKG
jgi:hypothetical protein